MKPIPGREDKFRIFSRKRKFPRSFVYFQLFQVFLLSLNHAENQTVSFSHALCVRRSNILLDNLLPTSSAQPSTKKALHFLNLSQLNRILNWFTQPGKICCVSRSVVLRLLFGGNCSSCCSTETTPTHWRCRKGRSRRFLSQNTNLKTNPTVLN